MNVIDIKLGEEYDVDKSVAEVIVTDYRGYLLTITTPCYAFVSREDRIIVYEDKELTKMHIYPTKNMISFTADASKQGDFSWKDNEFKFLDGRSIND